MSDVETLSIVGCGAVATPLTRSFLGTGQVTIQQIWNGERASSERAAARVGAGRAASAIDELAVADILLLGVSDRLVTSVARQLSRTRAAAPGTIAFHLSGALPAEALDVLRGAGAVVASLHPVISVPSLQHSPPDLRGTFCAIEGDDPACDRLEQLAAAAGMNPFRIGSENKALYHAGAVVATNYFVALEELAVSIYGEAGIPRGVALEFLRPFIQGALDNLRASSRGAALSGPIARGDKDTIVRHLSALESYPRWAELYKLLGQEALELVRARGGWKDEHDELSAVLGGGSGQTPE